MKWLLKKIELAIGEDDSSFQTLFDEYSAKGGNLHAEGTNGLTILTRLVNVKTESLLALSYLLSKMDIKDMTKPDGKGRMALCMANALPMPIKEQRVKLLDSRILIGALKVKGGKASFA